MAAIVALTIGLSGPEASPLAATEPTVPSEVSILNEAVVQTRPPLSDGPETQTTIPPLGPISAPDPAENSTTILFVVLLVTMPLLTVGTVLWINTRSVIARA